jgi:hypothetical protein
MEIDQIEPWDGTPVVYIKTVSPDIKFYIKGEMDQNL